jgi:uncharacterized protein (TIGR03437 family)
MKNLLSKIIFLSAFIALFISCTSHDEMAPVAANPTITSIWPLSGGYGSTVVITGTNFSTTAANNKVTINGVDATVTAATATQLTITVPACGGNGTVNVSTSSATATGPTFTYIPDVFAVGYEDGDAKLWKNGVATALTDGTHRGIGKSVFLVGGDVYVAGFESNGNKAVAKIWKNGVATALTDGSKNAVANSVFVVGNDVYVAFEEEGMGTHFVSKIWKNGVATALTDGSKDNSVNSLYVMGNDVYAAGYIADGTNGNLVAKVWKNGIASSLSDANEFYMANSVFASGNDLYVALNDRIWKNGITTTLSGVSLNSIYVSGTNVYACGTGSGVSADMTPKVVKNGVVTSLTDGTKRGESLSVYAFGNDVYVGGYEVNVAGGLPVAKVWKNGVATNLTNGSHVANVLSIVVR